jgi:hypothetical protein
MNDRIPVREGRRPSPGGLRWGLAGLVALAAVAGAGACTKSLEVPAINPTPTGQVIPGKVVWHDLVTTDVDVAKRFYGELFGWTFQTIASDGYDYVIAMIGPRPIAGIMRPEKRLTGAAEWVQYFSVADVDAAAALIEPNGGVLILKPEDLPHRGRIAFAEDPEGAPFGIIRSDSGDRPDGVDSPHNDFLWNELWSNDFGLAALFYRDAIGLDSEVLIRKTGDYLLFASGGEKRAGGILIPQPDIEPQWLPTIRVIDIKATVERARKLGGEIALEPRWDIEDGMVAIISDPNGAGMTIRQWEGDR